MKDKVSDNSPATTELDDKALNGVVGGMNVGSSSSSGIPKPGPKGSIGPVTNPEGEGGGFGKDKPGGTPGAVTFPGPR
jgi:hypothetical protein